MRLYGYDVKSKNAHRYEQCAFAICHDNMFYNIIAPVLTYNS